MADKARPSLGQTQKQFGRQAGRYAQSSLHRRGDTPNPPQADRGMEAGVNPRRSRGRVSLSTRTRQLTPAAAERATPGRLVTGFFVVP